MFVHMCVCAPVASHCAWALQERKQQAAAHKAAEDKAAAEAAAADVAAVDATVAGEANPVNSLEAAENPSNPEVVSLLQSGWRKQGRHLSVPPVSGISLKRSIQLCCLPSFVTRFRFGYVWCATSAFTGFDCQGKPEVKPGWAEVSILWT